MSHIFERVSRATTLGGSRCARCGRSFEFPFALLVILEPVARLMLAGFALLMTLTALFWLTVGGLSVLGFWGMLGLGVGAWLLLALYYALVRSLSA